MFSKLLVSMFLGMICLFGSPFSAFYNVASAEDVWVGTSSTTGMECYVMTETVQYFIGARRTINVKLKMLRPSDGEVQYIDYTFGEGGAIRNGGKHYGLWFRNSDENEGEVTQYGTPIEWEMYQVIR